MVRLMREIQDLCEAVFHEEHPDHYAQDAQHAWLPSEPQSCKIGHETSSLKAGDLFGRLSIRLNLSAAIAQPLPSLVRRNRRYLDHDCLRAGSPAFPANPHLRGRAGNSWFATLTTAALVLIGIKSLFR